MVEFEENDEVDMRGPGRPPMGRTKELLDALVKAKEQSQKTGKYGFSVKLAEDEVDRFYRFTQRCRSAAKKADIKISVSDPKDGIHGNVRILTEGETQ